MDVLLAFVGTPGARWIRKGYCWVCGFRITGEDFRESRAVTVLRRHYCRKCSKGMIQSSSEGGSHDPTVTPPKLKTRTARISLAQARAGQGSRKLLWIMAAVVLRPYWRRRTR